MFSLFRTLSLRYLWRHWLHALIVASIALGVGAWVTTEILYITVTRSLRETASPLAGKAQLYVLNRGTVFIDASLADRLKAEVPGIDRVEPLIIDNVKIAVGQQGLSTPRSMPEAVLLGFPLPEEKDAHDPLAERDIRLIDVDREALRRGVVLEKIRDKGDLAHKWLNSDMMRTLVGDKLKNVPDGIGERLVPPVVPIFLKRFFPQGLRTPVLVGEQLDIDVLKGRKHFTIEAGDRKLAVEVVGKLRATGAAAALGGQAVLMYWPSAARLLGKPGQVQRLDVKLKPDVDRHAAQEQARKAVQGKAEVETTEDQNQRLQHVLKGLETGFRLCGAGALVVGLFLVYNALSVSVAERRHDIGILRSVGATRPQVRLLFLGEALLLGTVGSLLGLPLGVAFSRLLLGPIKQAFEGVFIPIEAKDVQASPQVLMLATGVGILTALAAALVPASRAAAEEPADAVRRAPLAAGVAYRLLQIGGSVTLALLGVFLIVAKPYLTPQLVIQLCLILIAVGLPLSALGYRLSSGGPALENGSATGRRSLMSGVYGAILVATGLAGLLMHGSLAAEKGTFAAVILILLGALLLIPVLASFLTRLLQRLTRGWLPLESRLAVDNLVRSPGRTGLVIASLAAGVAMTVQTAGMIKSNVAAYRDWLDATFRADFYLASGDPASASVQSRRLTPQLKKEVLAALPPGTRLVGEVNRHVPWNADGHTSSKEKTYIFLNLIDAMEHYRANLDREDTDENLELWRRLGTEPGTVIVSENFALMHGVAVGDTFRFNNVDLRVIGTVVDYNWIRGSIWIDRQQNQQAFNAEDVNLWGVYLPPGSRNEAGNIRDQLTKSKLGARHLLAGLTREEVRDSYLQMIYRIYGVAYTQELLIGMVAILGVIMSLLISVLSRQRELGLLRALGATRPQVMHTVLAEAVLIGLVGTVLGIALGLPLEWYAVRIILFEETGFLFAVRIPWLETAIIAALAVLAATVAGLAPAAHAIRLRIADAIAYE